MEKYRVTLTENQIKILNNALKWRMKDPETTEDWARRGCYCDILDHVNGSVKRSKKRKDENLKELLGRAHAAHMPLKTYTREILGKKD